MRHDDRVQERYGHYTLVRKIGEGAMGVVWSARDDRLGRSVALKLIQKDSGDPSARSRLWREARAAASVSHPNVCHVYEVGEDAGELYVAMELLEGEPLSSRISRSAFSVPEAMTTALAILDALSALHARGIIHRDLKPSNVFMTPHGVKLLDFGLARPTGDGGESLDLTRPGTIVGTPRYMAPEQWAGEEIGPRADLFACGSILFEMLTGRPAFEGETLPAICHAVVHEQPPALAGGPEIQAIDRVIHRALAKKPADRFTTAASMAEELRAVRSGSTDATMPAIVRAVTRLVVLPFRLLRDDPEIDFLGISLADAITSSLCGLESLVVRASRSAMRFSTGDPDIQKIGSELEVDAVLLGTILRVGSKIRLATQLVDAQSATLIWSRSLQSERDDLFEMQDELTQRVIEGLAVPLTKRDESRLRRDIPATAHGYEMYLRATHLGVTVTSSSMLATARDLFRSCLEDDPKFAPAWARLGRIHRVIAKYGHGNSEENVRLAREAFARAFELNPDLPLAHSYYTYFEIEELNDPAGAMLRLLGRLRARSLDPDIYAGLITACRFCGLYDASIAAAENARRLDPNLRTSIHYTWWITGQYQKAFEEDRDEVHVIRAMAAEILSGKEEAMRLVESFRQHPIEGHEHHAIRLFDAALRQDREGILSGIDFLLNSGFHDPEGIFVNGRALCAIGEEERALELLDRVVKRNFCIHEAVMKDPRFESLRQRPEIEPILQESRRRAAAAREKFRDANGYELLGVMSGAVRESDETLAHEV